jgi:VanZ family protein
MPTKRQIRIAFVIALAITTWALLTTSASVDGFTFLPDKVWHAAAFAVLTALLLGSMVIPRYAVAALGMLIYGVAMEAIQQQLGDRVGEPGDMVANGIGIVIGVFAYFGITTYRSRSPRQ